MLYNLEIRHNAILDTQNAVDYYDAISVNLGNRFEEELLAAYKKITTNPQFYKYMSKNRERTYRCINLKHFPYIVIYKIDGSTVVAISVFNTSRNPVYGQP